MYVWFIGLNHSKYRFLFHAVYIGIMNAIRKPTFHAARYNRVKYLGSDVRSRPLQSARRAFFSYRTVVILHRERPCLGSRSGGVFKLSIAVLRRGFFPSPDGSELYLCMPKNFSAYKRCSPCEVGWRSRVTPLKLPDIVQIIQFPCFEFFNLWSYIVKQLN